ncbi:nucleic acid/nucleotide deaminase domain-containing protein [Streptomyces sp. NPDC056149]|uniref:WXG100-like domain-containing protein n=1 Tax=Streptomyces sp. NPDC056149 TaxID=3345728 RepID=UPI0035D61298
MGVVLPGWADEVLDLIGVSWPNVDEDDYREMANAMREFADDIEDGANQAHTAIQGLVGSAGGSIAVEALNSHWGTINDKHLKGLAECGRLAGTAMDGVATLIEGAKIAALVQLGILAAEVIAAQAAAPFTFGLSEAGAIAATQATRAIVKRLIKEVCEQIAQQVVSMALTPVEEALGAMVGDLVVQLGANALGGQKGVDLGRTAEAGKDAAKSAASGQMELLSTGGGHGGGSRGGSSGHGGSSGTGGSSGHGGSSGGGGGSGGSGGFTHDPEAHSRVATSLESAGSSFRDNAGGKIRRAKSHQGRTRGKDVIANTANPMLDKVISGIEDGTKKVAKHLGEDMSGGVKQMDKNHRDNDKGLSGRFKGLNLEGEKGGSLKRKGGPSSEGSDTEEKKPKRRKKPSKFPLPADAKRNPKQDATKVDPRTHDLAVKVNDRRKEKGDKSGKNYAAFEFEDEHGNKRVEVGRSDGVHSERVVGVPLLERQQRLDEERKHAIAEGRDPGPDRKIKVTRMYSERDYCNQKAPNCNDWTRHYFPDAERSYAFEYDNTKDSRRQGNRDMQDHLRWVFGEPPIKRRS